VDLDTYRAQDALGLAELVRTGAVTPDELLDAALAMVDAVNPSCNAVVTRFEGDARRAIRDGLPDGPFRGVPFIIKDLWTRVAGVVTTNGSRLFADDVAPADSEIVRRYRAAGLVLFAKSNTPELGLNASTESVLLGPARNPWDPTRSTGGSSGGAAAAVAAGIVPMAHATDGGGSIRIPASCCGLFGLKPSRGRITLGPERSEGWAGMSAQHVVSRTVRDSAAALDATAGTMSGDPYTAPPAPAAYLEESAVDPPPLRVGWCLEPPSGAPVDPACRAAAEATARRCEALGHRVASVAFPAVAADAAAAQITIISVHSAATVDARATALGRALAADDLEPVTAAMCERGRLFSGAEYVAAVQAMHRVGRAMGELFETIDVLVTPMLGRPPVELGTLDTRDPPRFGREIASVTPFAGLANLTGQPAMTLPLDGADGLPIGTQVLGRFGDEATLVRLAGQLERTHGWWRPAR